MNTSWSVNATVAVPQPPEQVRTVPTLIAELDSALQGIYAAEQRLSGALGRLVNPRPEGVNGSDSVATTPSTVEGRLSDAARSAQALANGLHALADRFDSAI